MNIEQRKQALMSRTYRMMFLILAIFGVPAWVGYYLGQYLDETFMMYPYGSVIALVAAFFTSWFVMIRIYKSLQKELKEIEAIENKEKDKPTENE